MDQVSNGETPCLSLELPKSQNQTRFTLELDWRLDPGAKGRDRKWQSRPVSDEYESHFRAGGLAATMPVIPLRCYEW